MKIVDITLPKFMDYYISENCATKITKILKNAVIDEITNRIVLIADNDYEVLDALKLIKSKSEMITVGNQYKYEYEMDVSCPNAHWFTFKFDDNVEFYCNLVYVNNLENNDLRIIFAIRRN